ncbi:MAG: flavodoxin [Candidatus Omnitrophota bacterium]|nr:flavodoxin [Candidatus Omnitrophota bacterium]
MKSIIIYYSYSGNTKKVAEILAEHLKQNGEVETIELKALDESSNFFKQGNRALKKVRAQIADTKFDLAQYDLICLGTPVWAFGPAPAMNAYLDKCSGLGNKEVVLFCTVGGTGIDRCLNYMQGILETKGAKKFKRFAFKQSKIKDQEFILNTIKESVRLWPNG